MSELIWIGRGGGYSYPYMHLRVRMLVVTEIQGMLEKLNVLLIINMNKYFANKEKF